MREKIEKILSPAIDVNAPYAKQMVTAIIEVFSEALTSPDHSYSVLRDHRMVYIKHGEVITSFTADQARHFGSLLIEGANELDEQAAPN